jgi:hypothetical protein
VARQIRGTLVNMPPRRQIAMRLVRAGDTLGNRAQVNVANGIFGVADVTPGTYVLQAYTSDTGPMFMGETPVTVGDSDLTGLTIAMSPPADLTVHVDVPPLADANLRARVAGVTGSVQAVPMDRRLLPPNFPMLFSRAQPDGTLVLNGLLPGRYELLINLPGPWYVASASQGDMDVLTGGFTVTAAGAQDVTIRGATGGGTLQGKIDTTDAGKEWTVALFSTTGGRAPILLEAFEGQLADPIIVPPGDYDVYVWPDSKQIAYREPETFSSLGSYANRVNVKEGTNEVTLKPIPSEALP